jgi:cobalt-zinc-cadmium resistance protein CzcA
MNGVPHMQVMRSISLYGLSEVKLTFEENTDDYFARQVVFERFSDLQLPSGVTPSLSPLFSPSGLVYRYVLESPDRSPQELKTIEDWVVERAYKSVPGVADDSGLGGTVMQYQVLLDPAKIYSYHISVPQVIAALTANNANAGGGFYSQGSQFFYVRGLGLVTKTEDIGNIVVILDVRLVSTSLVPPLRDARAGAIASVGNTANQALGDVECAPRAAGKVDVVVHIGACQLAQLG